jgi:hypothetical protein
MALEQKPTPTVRLPNPSAQPFVAALKTARLFTVVFFWISMISVLLYVVTFVLTDLVGLYEDPLAPVPAAAPAAPTPTDAARPAAGGVSWGTFFENSANAGTFFGTGPGKSTDTADPGPPAVTDTAAWAAKGFVPSPPPKDTVSPSATALPPVIMTINTSEGKVVGNVEAPPKAVAPRDLAREQHDRAVYWKELTTNTLRPMKVVGVLSGFLLGITIFLYLQIALLGRLGGVKQLTMSLFMCILFMASVLGDKVVEGSTVSTFYDFGLLLEKHAAMLVQTDWPAWKIAMYYCRFLVLPATSALLLAWSGIQFASGYKDSVIANE